MTSNRGWYNAPYHRMLSRVRSHPFGFRQGDDLIYVAAKEALPHELLVLLEVPTLFDARLVVVGDTLGARLFDGGDVGSIT